MKAQDQIFSKPLKAFKAFAGIKSKLTDESGKRNEIPTYVASLEPKVNEATVKLFDDPSIETFKAVVAARLERETSVKVMGELFSSIGSSQVQAITESENTINVLKESLEAYAGELSKRIDQICADARELSERGGIDYTEPPAVATLRGEMAKASEGAVACENNLNGGEANAEVLWRKLSPLIRVK